MARDEDLSVGVSARGGAHVPHAKYDPLIARAKELPPVPTIVAHPCDETSLRGATEAAEAGIIVPILVGPAAKIAAAAQTHGLDISRFDIAQGVGTATAWCKKRRSSSEGKASPRRAAGIDE